MCGLVGVTAIDTSVAGVTVRRVEPEMLPDVALIVVEPAASAETFPLESTVATDTADELHATDAVRSLVLLSEKIPVAVNCSGVATAMPGLTGETMMDTSVAPDEELPLLLPPPPPPQPMTNAAIKRMRTIFNFIRPLNSGLPVPDIAIIKDFRNIVNTNLSPCQGKNRQTI